MAEKYASVQALLDHRLAIVRFPSLQLELKVIYNFLARCSSTQTPISKLCSRNFQPGDSLGPFPHFETTIPARTLRGARVIGHRSGACRCAHKDRRKRIIRNPPRYVVSYPQDPAGCLVRYSWSLYRASYNLDRRSGHDKRFSEPQIAHFDVPYLPFVASSDLRYTTAVARGHHDLAAGNARRTGQVLYCGLACTSGITVIHLHDLRRPAVRQDPSL